MKPLGYGYGPGIGEGYDRLVMIVSRASGAPVIAGAHELCGPAGPRQGVQGGRQAGVCRRREGRPEQAASRPARPPQQSPPPRPRRWWLLPKEVVTAQPSPASRSWTWRTPSRPCGRTGIYAESGMGCTGPLVLVSEANLAKATDLLKEAGYVQ